MSADASDLELHAQFITAWQALLDAADACHDSVLGDAPLPCWVWQTETSGAAREAGADILKQFLYVDDQPARESVICPGVLGASTATLRVAAQLNACKDRVRALLQVMDTRYIEEEAAQPGKRGKTQTLTQRVLAQEGLARLHRMQVYRHARLLHHRPDRIALGWAHTKRVRRYGIAAVRAMLEERLERSEHPGLLLSDMNRLTYLAAGEQLALVDQEPPHVRANLAWRISEKPGWLRRQVTLALPLFFASRPGQPMPALKPLPSGPDAGPTRIRRVGRVLEPEPYLRTLAIYRYCEGRR